MKEYEYTYNIEISIELGILPKGVSQISIEHKFNLRAVLRHS